MSGILRAIVLSLTILAVLAFSAFGTTAVYADGETPAEEVSTETSTEECKSDDCAQDEETAADSEGESGKPGPGTTDDIESTEGEELTEDAGEGEPVKQATPEPTEEAPAPTEEPAKADDTESAPAEGLPADTTVLDAVPDNTTVTVLNAEGEAQPLATQDSVNAIETSDPIWCPAGQSPTPGANGCTQSFTSFTDLLTFLSGNASFSGAGTIYVQQGAYLGGEDTVDFNSYDLTNISNADLTITGGWNTSDNTIDATTGSTFSNVTLVIGSSTNPWGGSLTLNNLNFGFDDGTGSFANGITIHSTTDINLSNVDVTNAGDDDAGGSGAELHAGNDVNINNSNFDRNKTGATIRAGGDVSIANSNFHNSNPAALRQVTGLDIIADGSVSLFQVLANGNRQAGAYIEAGGPVAISNAFFSNTQSMQGSDFLGYGLTVVTASNIAIDAVEANNNFLWGAMLTAGGDVSISNSIFNANTTEDIVFIDDTGLIITDAVNVSIFNTTADENRLIGATINATGDVSISESSFSNNNGVTDTGSGPTYHGYGLQVITLGNIFINGVTASGNTLFGAHLESGLDTLVSNSFFSNQTSGDAADPTGRGLEIISDGNVLLDNVTISGNQTFGANIQTSGDVFLQNMTVTDNGTNGVEVVTSCGNVFLINGTYTGNGQYGLSILNSLLTTSGAPIFGGNGVGDIFNDPGTCVFAPASPLSPPTPPAPPVQEPGTQDEPSTSGNQQGVNSLARAVKHSAAVGVFGVTKFSGGNLSTVGKVTLNSLFGIVSNGDLHVGIFTGNYVYIYSASGLEILALAPSPFEQFAINRP